MNIIISGLHLEKNPTLRKYAKKKAEKLIKYHRNIQKIDVRLISQKAHRGQDQDYSCEIEVAVPGRVLEIVDTQREMAKAIDFAVERMKRVLVKLREKDISKQHKRGILNKLLNRFGR